MQINYFDHEQTYFVLKKQIPYILSLLDSTYFTHLSIFNLSSFERHMSNNTKRICRNKTFSKITEKINKTLNTIRDNIPLISYEYLDISQIH